jgi:hypothetical protein
MYKPGLFIIRSAATYSPTLYRSTIGADGLNFSVRNGKRWSPVAKATLNLFNLKIYQFEYLKMMNSLLKP